MRSSPAGPADDPAGKGCLTCGPGRLCATLDLRPTGMVMEPVEPTSGSRPARSTRSETAGPVTGPHQVEPRRPLLMDPAGPRPSGFAPPSVLTSPPVPAVVPAGTSAGSTTKSAGPVAPA